jgi:N-acetylglucosaminyldiphosphoundecaprenol N-acetyl-beta-D-mannosaminyltransferase
MTAAFGIEFASLTSSQIVSHITNEHVPIGAGPRMVATANLDHIVNLARDAEFRDAYSRAWMVTADGMPVHFYAQLRGAAGPARVTGSDLIAELLPALSAAEDRIFLLVSDWRTGRRLLALLMSKGFRRPQVRFVVPEFGFEQDQTMSENLTRSICAHRTTHLILGLGSPKSEVWVDRYRARLGDCYVLCVGAGLEFLAGTKRRAPRWMRDVGLEWSWRIAQEPKRLWRRYTIGAWYFARAMRDDLVSHRNA